jgi:Predicted transcriptional regulator containing an HTH domain and an uncharacterized domain shared with the mammalian protein Schlafen
VVTFIDYAFIEEIISLINSGHEGDYWDFKQVWHKENELLLHDILCFANTVHNKNCYIIIGVSDSGEVVGVSDENRRKQADILDMLSNTMFAGDNSPEVRVVTIRLKGVEIDVLTVLNSFNVPFYLKNKSKKYINIKDGYIYTRGGDKNTPINQNASIQQVEMLWKKRLGLTQPPLEQIVTRLENKFEWALNDETHYNIYKPEFMLVEEFYDDEYVRRKGEFYVYSQYNSKFLYKGLKIMFNQTILKEFELISLDSGRYKTPIPTWGYVCHDEYKVNHEYSYKYFLMDSIDYKLQKFFFDSDDMEEVYAKRRFDEVILYFADNEERLSFEFYVENRRMLVAQYIEEVDKTYFQIDVRDEHVKNIEKQRLSSGLALNRLLKEYRELLKKMPY